MNRFNKSLAAAFALAALFLPNIAQATSLKQFNALTKDQQTAFVSTTVDTMATDVAKVNPVLSKAIRNYFSVTPSGKDQPPGLLAFGASLKAINDLGNKGKLNFDEVRTEGILLAVIKTNLMNKQPAAPVSGKTVYQFLLLDDSAQVKEIQRLCGNVVADFSKKTEGGKPIPEDAYQDRRQVANLLRALFLRGSTKESNSLYGSVKYQIKKTAGIDPFSAVQDSLQTIVFEYFDKFKSASIVNDSDASQQSYFLSHLQDYYNFQRAQVRQEAAALLKQIDKDERETCQQLRELCGETVLSNGRRVLHVDHGETYDEAMKKFQKCIAACRDTFARESSTSPAPSTQAATTPPAATPSSPPASPPADHPFGGGGFITPPTNFKVMLCVSADVANNPSWSQPVAGSKMAAFKDMVARYIVSVAKPGWEYWIVQGRYERFDPATATSGDQVVSAVSPDSGRFDEFHPKCPSGYGAFWVQVNH